MALVCPDCGELNLYLNPNAPAYPGGIALQYNWTLRPSAPMAKGESVSCLVPLGEFTISFDGATGQAALASYSSEYVLKFLQMTIYWDGNFKQFPFTIQLFDAGTEMEIPPDPFYPPYTFVMKRFAVGEEIVPADLVVKVTNSGNKSHQMSLAGSVVGDRR